MNLQTRHLQNNLSVSLKMINKLNLMTSTWVMIMIINLKKFLLTNLTHKEDFITKFNTKISKQTMQFDFLQMKSMLLILLNSINKITMLPLYYHSPKQLQLLQQTPSQLNPSPIFLFGGGGYKSVLVTLIMNNKPRVTLQWSFLLQESEVFLPELLGFLTQ